MIGYFMGYADTDDVFYCPKCGARITSFKGDASAVCEECGIRFAVIVVEDTKDKGVSEA